MMGLEHIHGTLQFTALGEYLTQPSILCSFFCDLKGCIIFAHGINLFGSKIYNLSAVSLKSVRLVVFHDLLHSREICDTCTCAVLLGWKAKYSQLCNPPH